MISRVDEGGFWLIWVFDFWLYFCWVGEKGKLNLSFWCWNIIWVMCRLCGVGEYNEILFLLEIFFVLKGFFIVDEYMIFGMNWRMSESYLYVVCFCYLIEIFFCVMYVGGVGMLLFCRILVGWKLLFYWLLRMEMDGGWVVVWLVLVCWDMLKNFSLVLGFICMF